MIGSNICLLQSVQSSRERVEEVRNSIMYMLYTLLKKVKEHHIRALWEKNNLFWGVRVGGYL